MSSLLFDVTVVVELFHLGYGLLHKSLDEIVKVSVLDLLDAILKVTASGSEVLSVDSLASIATWG